MTSSAAIAARMRWLACLAVVLMVVAPTVSRGLAAVAPATAPVWAAMCTSMGPRTIDVAPLLAKAGAPADIAGKSPAQLPDPMTEACGYCVLVAPLLLALCLFLGASLCGAAAPVARPRRIRLRVPRNARGLGAQGPPLVA